VADTSTYSVRADELKLGMVVVYPTGLRKRIVGLRIWGGDLFPGSIHYEYDDGGCATMPPDSMLRVEITRVLTPPGEFTP
jgi:hypothetical protein